MPNVKFVLKEPQTGIPSGKQKETLVYLIYRYGGRRLKISTGKKVLPEFWNDKSQRVRETNKYTQYSEFNAILNKYKAAVEKAYDRCILNDEMPTNQKLKVETNSIMNNLKISQSCTLNEYIDQFIAEIEKGTRLTERKKNYEKGTIKNYQGFKVQFNLFQEETRRKLNFSDITIDFYDEFVLFFNKKGYSPNTIGRHIKNLKTIMRAAREEGLHTNVEIDRKKFRILKEETKQVYCSEEELERMYELDLSDKPHLEKVRDLFLIGCYTAQRFSDYSRINKDTIRKLKDGINVIELTQKKTGERVTIPIHWKLLQILEKYNYTPPKIHEQKLNKYIKEVGGKAGIIEPVENNEVKGGMKVKKMISKSALIKTHTARRSGCTNMYLAGIPTIDIMKISGHKTEREFLKYINVTKEETARGLSVHPYFTGKTLKIAK